VGYPLVIQLALEKNEKIAMFHWFLMHHLSMFHRYLNDYRGYMKSVTLANENRGTPVRPQNLNPKWLPADACRGMCGRPKAMNLLFGFTTL
jgi:hypothetical protein